MSEITLAELIKEKEQLLKDEADLQLSLTAKVNEQAELRKSLQQEVETKNLEKSKLDKETKKAEFIKAGGVESAFELLYKENEQDWNIAKLTTNYNFAFTTHPQVESKQLSNPELRLQEQKKKARSWFITKK